MSIFYIDAHVHSKYSRATGKDLDLENLEKYARIKGVNLLGTGDFTHPKWFSELKNKLKEDKSGILRSKSGFPFILQTEVSLIYTQGNQGRRVHNLVLAPDFDTVSQITEYLLKHGRVDYDGRPIFGISCPDFVESLKQISKEIHIIPAHIWTSWFSLFGANSGFNSVQECFQDQTKHIFALETGLSSSPAMNWRLSQLDKYSLVSFSDLHAFWPWRIGRECTVLDLKEISYKNIIDAIKKKNPKEFLFTIEFYPEEGKYHWTGHRTCGVVLPPEEAKQINDICPKCKSKLTVGVAERVEELADRPEGFVPENAILFKCIVPLSEIIAKIHSYGIATKNVWQTYNKLIAKFGTEFNILLNAPEHELAKESSPELAKAIIMNREGNVSIKPGYDGVYGEPSFGEEIKITKRKQSNLTEF